MTNPAVGKVISLGDDVEPLRGPAQVRAVMRMRKNKTLRVMSECQTQQERCFLLVLFEGGEWFKGGEKNNSEIQVGKGLQGGETV